MSHQNQIYEHIVYDPAEHVSFGALSAAAYARTLTVNGFSKSFAMTGWRMGYLAAPRAFATAAARIQIQTTSGASSIAMEAAVAALGLGHRGGDVVGAMKAAFLERRDYCVARLRAMRRDVIHLDYGVPEGAFYLLPNIERSFGAARGGEAIETADDFCRLLLSENGLAVVPGDAFGEPRALRISYAASMQTLEDAMNRLEAFVNGIETAQ